MMPLQFPAEGLVQEGFFQLVEGGELALVEGFEALGFVLPSSSAFATIFFLLRGFRGTEILQSVQCRN